MKVLKVAGQLGGQVQAYVAGYNAAAVTEFKPKERRVAVMAFNEVTKHGHLSTTERYDFIRGYIDGSLVKRGFVRD
jgi:hypothetical protein